MKTKDHKESNSCEKIISQYTTFWWNYCKKINFRLFPLLEIFAQKLLLISAVHGLLARPSRYSNIGPDLHFFSSIYTLYRHENKSLWLTPKKITSSSYSVLATTGKSCSKKKSAFAQLIKVGNIILGDFLGSGQDCQT